MNKKSEIGKLGEDLACRYLVSHGYHIIERNYRQRFGEIDIIAKGNRNELVLVEVKTVTGEHPVFSGEDQMTSAKVSKFKKIAQFYANNYFRNNLNGNCRLDLIAVSISGNDCRLKHYKNIS